MSTEPTLYLWAEDARPEDLDGFARLTQPRTKNYRVRTSGGPPDPVQRGDVVLAMGGMALKALRAADVIGGNRAIKSLRSRVLPYQEGVVMVTYHPEMQYIDASMKDEITWDVRLARRLVSTGTLDPPIGTYEWITEEDGYFRGVIEAIGAIYERTGEPVPVANDLETMGLSPDYPDRDIVSISLTVFPGYSDLFYWLDASRRDRHRVTEHVAWVLNSEKVRTVGANFKFDRLWYRRKMGVACTNHTADTMLMGTLLDENRSNSLSMHAKTMTDMGGYDRDMEQHWDKGHMELVPKDSLVTYAGGDTDANLRAYYVLKPQLVEDNLDPSGRRAKRSLSTFYINILHPAADAFYAIEERGLVGDEAKFQELKSRVEAHMAERKATILAALPEALKRHHGGDDLKLSRPQIISDYLFSDMGLGLEPKIRTPKSDKPSTAATHLEMFADHEEAGPVIRAHVEWKQGQKTVSTYIDGFLEHMRPDGRFHPTYFLFRGRDSFRDTDSGTVTGRSSCKDPAFQVIPKHHPWAKEIRRCFSAPPGYVMMNFDFSQGELRIAACWAGEPTMIQAYKDGKDLHAITAARMSGMTMEDFYKLSPERIGDLRTNGKAGNFGLLYGMSPEGYVTYAWDDFRLAIDLDRAERDHAAFFETYPGLPNWHTRQKQEAYQRGYVRSPLGRVRHLPLIRSPERQARSLAERQAINSPIQSTLSDMMLWVLAILRVRHPELWVCGMVHDSGLAYVPEDDVELWARRITEIMATLPLQEVFGWRTPINFPGDVEVGPNMGDLAGYEVAA